jgi:hypothetical protein
MRRPTAIVVTILDSTTLNKEAFECLPKDDDYRETTGCQSHQYGIVETKRGLFALCSEGVGPKNPITAKNKLDIDFWAEVNGHTKDSSLPAMIGHFDDMDLIGLATKETVNLTDFISTYGARLENNYDTWRTKLEEANT